MIRTVTATCFALLLFSLPAPQAWSAPAMDQLLPQTTKGFLSIPDVQDFRLRWNQTQLGKLCADPVMQPFAQDLQRQFRDKLLNGSFRVALTWDELFDVCGGELCVAGIQPGNAPEAHAAVLILDITGRRAQAEQVIAKIGEELARQGAPAKCQAG